MGTADAIVDSLRTATDASAVAMAIRRLNELDDVEAVVDSGGVEAVLGAMDVGNSAACFEQACVLWMSLAAAAVDGHEASARTLASAKIVAVIIDGLDGHQASIHLELGEAAVAALMQLACLDVSTALEAGVAAAVVTAVHAVGAGGWLLFLCARTISWCAVKGGEGGRATLRKATAVPALLHAIKQARRCDPSCGEPFGVPDAIDQLHIEARRALALLVAQEGEAVTPRARTSSGTKAASAGLDVALYVLRDRVVVQGLVTKPQLNGAGGIIVEVGEPGCGPDAASGRYGVRIELPDEQRGVGVKVKPTNLRLAPRELSAQIDALDAEQTITHESPLPAHVDTKFGRMSVRVVGDS